ncbi:MAG: hypothetical protein Q8P04_01900, partial [bacterium]|nr:hypothetical protein [bacterium]
IVFGGILYTVSAGNASKQDDAKQWITGALIGLLLLFGSYLILNTINPELTKLNDLKLIVNEAAQSGDAGSVIIIDPGSTDPVPVEPTADLRAQVNPIIFAKPNDASAVAIGCAPRAIGPSECAPIDRNIWRVIVYLQNRGFNVRISSMVGTHDKYVHCSNPPCNISRHWDGHAIDIDMVNGKLVSGADGSDPKPDTIALLQALLELRGSDLVPRQAIFNGNGGFDSEAQRYQINGGQQVGYVDGDHTDHVHIGY